MKILKAHNIRNSSEANRKAEGKIIWQVYKRILGYVFNYWFVFAIGISGIILNSAVDSGLTWSLKPLLDEGFIARNQQFISLLPIAVIIAFLLRGTAYFVGGYCISRISRSIIMEMRQQIFAKLLKLPASYYDKSTTGGLISALIYNVEQVSAATAATLITVIRDSFFIMGLLIVMFVVSWKLTLLFFSTVPFIALTTTISSKMMRRYGRKLQAGMGDVTHIAEEAIEGYRVIRTFGGEAYETHKFNRASGDNRKRELQMAIVNNLASPMVQVIIAFIIAAVLYLMTNHMDSITAGGFASILAAMLAILKPLKNITTINNSIQRGVVGAEGVFELLDQEDELDEGTQSIVRANGRIEFRHIDFAYKNHPEKHVLHDINFLINPGETVALVGKSGSGKSTIVNLLPRFYTNYSGKILIDKIDSREIQLTDLRAQFAFVSQNVTLFNDTIRNNIAYGRFSGVSEKEIIAATTAANAWEFVKELPNGLDTLIGENGLLLSGGQRQRLAIARAILKDAPILILDEATSALDTESERYIQGALERLMENRTTLVIAHRLSTIENADRIVVLKEGRIIEIGSHNELITQHGEYAQLHEMQFRDTQTDRVNEKTAEPI